MYSLFVFVNIYKNVQKKSNKSCFLNCGLGVILLRKLKVKKKPNLNHSVNLDTGN